MCDPVAGPQLDMREKLCAKAASRANSSNATKRCQGRNLGTKNKKMHQWLVQVAECDGSGLHRGMCRAPHHDTVRVLQEPLPPKRVRFMDKASASDTAKACVNVATVLLRDRHTLGISAPASETIIDHPLATWRRAMLRSAAGAQISRLLIVADNFPAKRMQSVFTRSTMISNPPPMLHQASCRRIVQPGGLQPGGSPCCNQRLV